MLMMYYTSIKIQILMWSYWTVSTGWRMEEAAQAHTWGWIKMSDHGHRPYPSSYRPEIDVSELLSDALINRYQQLIGMLWWSIKLGRIDIQTEVSCLSQHLCAPREGHFDSAYKICRYLQKNIGRNPCRISFGPLIKYDDENIFNEPLDKEEWIDFYPDVFEAMSRDMLEPLGNPVVVWAWVDASHAVNLANRRSHSGILIYTNNVLILSYSKWQNTVESSNFGSELVELRIATDMIEAFRCKLRCFGIPIDSPDIVLCDDKSVVTNSSVSALVLNKRHNATWYHQVSEAQAA